MGSGRLPSDIRVLRPSDAPWLAALHGEAFERPWSADMLRAELALHTVLGLATGACDGAWPRAFLLVSLTPPESEVLTLAVAPHARRQGWARHLLTRALARLGTRGVSRLILEVGEDNLPAQTLYLGLGFEIEGRRAKYYKKRNGERIDALVMSRAISRQSGS